MCGTLERLAAAAIVIVLVAAAPLFAQVDILTGKALKNLSSGALDSPSEDIVSVDARLVPIAEGRTAQFVVTAKIKPGWHIYSLTQTAGGPIRSKLTLGPSDSYRVVEDFHSLVEPARRREPAFDNLPVETHEKDVIWQATLELNPGADINKLDVPGRLMYQACNANACNPPKSIDFVGRLDSSRGHSTPVVSTPPSTKEVSTALEWSGPKVWSKGIFRSPSTHAEIRGRIDPATAAPGSSARLILSAEPAPGWHIYALGASDPGAIGSKPTLIKLEETSGLRTRRPLPSAQAIADSAPASAGSSTEGYHDRPVDWTIEIEVPATASPGEYPIAGIIGFQTCQSDVQCDRPLAARFRGVLDVGGNSGGQTPLEFMPAKYSEAAGAATQSTGAEALRSAASSPGFDPRMLTVIRDEGVMDASIIEAILWAFLGGLILNLMPCVLPVIGLKILAFVEQAGHSRAQIFALNLWYTLGMMIVFMALATLAVFAGFGWGQLFGYAQFNIALAAVVFVMALSFLGVWEIPIPGFVGHGAAAQLAEQEGPLGAVIKGVITTLLATPCSGPFLASALTWSAAKPPLLTYLVFASIGLGMASPYLLIGAFPRLVRWLPKPGMWMETFKHFLGFVLLATVVYFLTFIELRYVVPTVALLFSLWAACWFIGRKPLTDPLGERLKVWLAASALATALGVFCFSWLAPLMEERVQLAVGAIAERGDLRDDSQLPWQSFSRDSLHELTKARKTVMVDFTADWCPNCKSLEKFVLNTPGTRKWVEANGIVPVKADWTYLPQDVTDMLDALGSKQIPVLAIFPAGQPNTVIVLDGVYTSDRLLRALRRAGPSKPLAQTAFLPTR